MSIPELENCHLDHIAIAVNDLDKAEKIYTDLGLVFGDKREIVADQYVETSFAAVDEKAHIELLKPVNRQGPIQKFLDSKGEGLHHLCFRVKSVKDKSEELLEKGYRLIYEEARIGAGNCLVNFIHPKSTGGVLIEISESLKE